MLPFTQAQFLQVFADYGAAVWPAQPVAYGLGAAALLALALRHDLWQRVTLALLGAMWLWTAIAYHWLFFTEINPAAVAFALLFAVQGAAFLGFAFARRFRFRFRWRPGARGFAGAALFGASFLLYPLTDLWMGHWPAIPAFGISPCPVTLFTLGWLLLAVPRAPLALWVIPLLWSLIGGTAAFLLGIPQDWVLLIAGPAAFAVALVGRGAEPRGRDSSPACPTG